MAKPDQESLFKALMDYTPDVIYFKDRDGRLVMVNRAYALGMNCRPEDVVGKTDFDIFPRAKAQKMFQDDRLVIEKGKSIIDKVERATRADGVDNYVSTTKIPRYDKDGNIVGLVGITRDITRRKQVEILREEKNLVEKKLKNLEEVNKVKSHFISLVSHEMRTPLTIVKEAIAQISEGLAGGLLPQQEALIRNASLGVERLKSIISDLLDISRIERGAFKLNYALVNLTDLLRESEEFFRKQAQGKGISLEYSYPKQDVNIFVDPQRLNQIFTNLMDNALKFTESDGKIKVEVKVLENRVRIGVIDSGIGIASRDLLKIFEMFTQVSGLNSANRKGLGLGLSIVKKLVEASGGEIWAESAPGVGSKFYFTLPFGYGLNLLEESIRKRINDLLDKGVSLTLLNLIIVNYQQLSHKRASLARDAFHDLSLVVDSALRDFKLSALSPEIVSADIKNGSMSIVFPELSEEKLVVFCKSLKKKIKEKVIGGEKEKLFVNLGILYYDGRPESAKPPAEFEGRLKVRKIYLGTEARNFKRVSFVADITLEPFKVQGKAIDLSDGGICFTTNKKLKTDERVYVRVELVKGNIMELEGRCRWLANVSCAAKGEGKYKAGIEFVNLTGNQKKIISGFINEKKDFSS